MKKQFKNSTIELIYNLEHDYEFIYKKLTNNDLDPIGNCIYWKDEELAKDLSMFFSDQSKYTNDHFVLACKLNDVYPSECCDLFDSVGWYPFLYVERTESNSTNQKGYTEVKNIIIFKSKFDYARFIEWIEDETEYGTISKEDSTILRNEVNRIYESNSHLNKNNLDYAYFEVLKYMIKFFS